MSVTGMCSYFLLFLDSSSSRQTCNLLTLHGSGSLCRSKWKSALLSFVVEHQAVGLPSLSRALIAMCVGVYWDFRFRNAYFGWQGLLKTAAMFQESSKR